MLLRDRYTSPALAGLGREERTKVGERSETGEGLARTATLTLVASRLDLSREERAR
jgi:hypothetical protein